jgi:hypothetical protein
MPGRYGRGFIANAITKTIRNLQLDATSLANNSSTVTAVAKMSAITDAESSPTLPPEVDA